jgi:hypothetical protein
MARLTSRIFSASSSTRVATTSVIMGVAFLTVLLMRWRRKMAWSAPRCSGETARMASLAISRADCEMSMRARFLMLWSLVPCANA